MKRLLIDQCGGIGDGKFDNTQVIRDALAQLSNPISISKPQVTTDYDDSGGVIRLTPGIWRTGPITLYSNCILEIDKGATLSFIPDFTLYPPVQTRWEGVECFAMHPCIFAENETNVQIRGEGTIDGNGSIWWDYRNSLKIRQEKQPLTTIERSFAALNPGYPAHPGGGGGRETQFLAPSCIQFLNCSHVIIEGVTVINSPFWTIHPVYCSELEISNVTISNPPDAPNTDGIDIDSCSNVIITECDIDVGDDAIALKSGSGFDGIAVGKPTSSVHISKCRVARAHGGVVIGSETAGGIHDIQVSDCVFNGTDRGIRIKTRRGRGGEIKDLQFYNVKMIGNLCPITINMYYHCGISDTERTEVFSQEAIPIGAATPSISNVFIQGVNAEASKASAGFFMGLPESPIRNLTLKDCCIATDRLSTIPTDRSEMYEGIPSITGRGVRMRYCTGVILENVFIENPGESFIMEKGVVLASD